MFGGTPFSRKRLDRFVSFFFVLDCLIFQESNTMLENQNYLGYLEYIKHYIQVLIKSLHN